MTKKFMLGAAISALMLSGAFAQTPNSPNPSSAPPAATKSMPPAASKSDQAKPAKSDQAKPMNAAEAEPAGGEAKIVMSQKPDQWLASNFKGTDVLGSDGKKIGDVSDILFDKNGKILAYVVSTGGFLGMGAKEVAFAPSAFTVEPGKQWQVRQAQAVDERRKSSSRRRTSTVREAAACHAPVPRRTAR